MKTRSYVFTRWGNGEIEATMCVSGETPGKGHSYSERTMKALNEVLDAEVKDPGGMIMGLQPYADKLFPWFKEKYASIDWKNADYLHEMSIKTPNWFRSYFTSMGKYTMLIGPEHLSNVFIPYKTFIPLPKRDCYDQVSVDDIRIYLKKHDPEMVIFCASIAANIYIGKLYREFPLIHMIDAGSVFDPYVGVNSRRYHQQIIDREAKK